MAAQLTEMKLLFLRLDLRWMKRAMTSLPVPDSPVIRTEASEVATCSASRSTLFITGSRKIRALCSSATAASTAAISWASGGRGTYSLAPARMAAAARSELAPMPQGDDRDMDALGIQAGHDARDVQIDVDHHQVGPLASPQGCQGAVDVAGVRDLGAAVQCDLAGGDDVPVERSNDE